MKRFVIKGGRPLEGEIRISKAKNSVLPIMASTLLTDEECHIKDVPLLQDVITMKRLLEYVGKRIEFKDHTLIIRSSSKLKWEAPYKLVSQMRASFCVLGPLLARHKKACVSLPGGCVIGSRPVDLHLRGLINLGANIKVKDGYVYAQTSKLRGRLIFLGGPFGPSVLATENIMAASCLCEGQTIIENAACEPEVVDLANFLKKMGAHIEGEGTPWIKIKGVKSLGGAEHTPIPDRIETGTFIIASLITQGEVLIKECHPQHLGAFLDILKRAGSRMEIKNNQILVRPSKSLHSLSVSTHPYPGFPTDLQAQYMSLMSVSSGVCVIKENVFPDRFMHVGELQRMGASIHREGPYAVVEGKTQLYGAEVMASDLRASAALVLAGLRAKGKTVVQRIYHLERGYEDLPDKLRRLGAKIKVSG